MKTKLLQQTFLKGILPLCFFFWSANAFAANPTFSGQTTAGDYDIVDVASLQAIATVVNAGTSSNETAKSLKNFTFHQTANIDMTGQTWIPIGTNDPYKYFAGTYDGGSFKISNLTCTRTGSDYSGVFGKLDTGGVLKNIIVENVNITGVYGTGGLVGNVCNNCTIDNCHVTSGTINATASSQVGGLIGYLKIYTAGTTTIVKNCHTSVNVNGDSNVGGLIGYFAWGNATATGTVQDCYATGNVTAGSTDIYSGVGGFVGAKDNSGINFTMQRCYATGSVSAKSGTNPVNMGGFIGYAGGSWSDLEVITNCYATGSVTGTSTSVNVGGFAGCNESSAITNCYATGAITAGGVTGGFIGSIQTIGTVNNCVALSPSISTTGTAVTFGKAIGSNTSTGTSSCYAWSGMTLPTGTLTGLNGTAVTKQQVNVATNWWNGTIGYFTNPTGIWTLADNYLPVLTTAGGTQAGTMPSHLSIGTAVNQPDTDNSFKVSVVDNKLQILSEGVNSVQIFNAAGKLMLQGVVYTNSFNVASLTSGVYIVKANTTLGVKMAKVIK